MATVARSFTRRALSCVRQTTPRQNPQSAAHSCPITQHRYRAFSVTPFPQQERDGDKNGVESVSTKDGEVTGPAEGLSDDGPADNAMLRDIAREVQEIERKVPMSYRMRTPKPGFWGDGEEDPIARAEDGDDEFGNDAITSMAHAELEQHREIREYARIIAWDMPSLSSLAKPFSLPPQTHLLRFRYTTYLGETHPAENKVVVEFCSKDLTPTYLTEEQRITLLKLIGPRYNPQKDLVHMSCEKFPTRAQNKRYLGDMVDKLIHESKEGDSFADVPLDLRHHKPKNKLTFPESWNMTETRMEQLEAQRNERKQGEQRVLGAVVDGNETIAHAVETIPTLTNPVIGRGGAREGVPVKSKKAQNSRMRMR